MPQIIQPRAVRAPDILTALFILRTPDPTAPVTEFAQSVAPSINRDRANTKNKAALKPNYLLF